MTVDESISPAPPREMGAGGYLLFAHGFYAAGGLKDFVGRFVSIGAAQAHFAPIYDDDEQSCGHIALGDEILLEWRYDWATNNGESGWFRPGTLDADIEKWRQDQTA